MLAVILSSLFSAIVAYAFIGLLFALIVHILSKLSKHLNVPEGIYFSSLKKGVFVGFLVALLMTVSSIIEYYYYFGVSKFVPQLGMAIFLAVFLPINLYIFENIPVSNKFIRKGIAFITVLNPFIILFVFGLFRN